MPASLDAMVIVSQADVPCMLHAHRHAKHTACVPLQLTMGKTGPRWGCLHAGRLQYEPQAVQELAEDLVDDLAAMGRLRDAATIVHQYLGDAARAVSLLTQVLLDGCLSGCRLQAGACLVHAHDAVISDA